MGAQVWAQEGMSEPGSGFHTLDPLPGVSAVQGASRPILACLGGEGKRTCLHGVSYCKATFEAEEAEGERDFSLNQAFRDELSQASEEEIRALRPWQVVWFHWFACQDGHRAAAFGPLSHPLTPCAVCIETAGPSLP